MMFEDIRSRKWESYLKIMPRKKKKKKKKKKKNDFISLFNLFYYLNSI